MLRDLLCGGGDGGNIIPSPVGPSEKERYDSANHLKAGFSLDLALSKRQSTRRAHGHFPRAVESRRDEAYLEKLSPSSRERAGGEDLVQVNKERKRE